MTMHLKYSLYLTSFLIANLPFISTVQPAQKKQWQDSSTNEDPKLDGGYSPPAPSGYSSGTSGYSGNVGGYSSGHDHSSGDIGNYGGGYGGHGGHSYEGNGHGGSYDSNGHGGGGYGGNGHGAGFGGSGHGGGGSYGGNGLGNGFGGEIHGGSYSGESHSESYSGNNHGGGFSGGLQNEGWDKNMKTIVKHVYKNIAVPHPVPAPVQVPVPKYIKYFKPFAIARPVGVPHIIPVIKHIQKPIPFFTALPIQQTVPVPKFVGLPVQVRVPRPVFIHVPKIVPVAKKVPVPVEVNIPKPYIVPIYKHVPVPVPHRVPKIINIIKEVPHFVKKPVPVYVDTHSSNFGHGNSFGGSGYSGEYGNDYHGGYGSEESNHYNGQHGHSHNSYGNMGMDYNSGGAGDYSGQQGYQSAQDSMKYNSPVFYNRQKIQNFNHYRNVNPNLQYPGNSYPRAHRIPNKSPTTQTESLYYQPPSSNFSSSMNSQSLYQDTKQMGGVVNNNNPAYVPPGSSLNTQGQASNSNELYYQGGSHQAYNTAVATPASYDSGASTESSSPAYSQPVYNPSSYAEYTLSQSQNDQSPLYVQQSNASNVYSQPNYVDHQTAQSTTTSNPGVMAPEASKSYSQYQQFPQNSFSNGLGLSQQSSSFNNIIQPENYNSFKDLKPRYPTKSNFEFHSFFKQSHGQPTGLRDTTPSWLSNNNFFNSAVNNKFGLNHHHNQPISPYEHQPVQNNAGFNPALNANNGNNYNLPQNEYQSNYYSNENQNSNYNNNYDNYVPSGSSHSSSSYSASLSPQTNSFQSDSSTNNLYKHNEKYDHNPSQNSYSSNSNMAVSDNLSPVISSVSYSNSVYGNNYGGNHGFSSQETRHSHGSNDAGTKNDLIEGQSNPSGSSPGFTPSGSSVSYSHNDFGNSYAGTQSFSPQDTNQASNSNKDFSITTNTGKNDPLNHYGSFSNFGGSQSYSPPEFSQGLGGNNAVSGNGDHQAQPDTLSDFVAGSLSNSYSQPATTQDSYSSTTYSASDSYSMSPQSSYQTPVYSNLDTQGFAASNNSVFSNSHPLLSVPGVTTSYSYSQQVSSPPTTYSGFASSFSNDDQFKDYSQKQSGQYANHNSASQQFAAYSPPASHEKLAHNSEPSKSFQGGYSSKLDEMEQHIQSSSSSIINVYTNSPDSKEAKKGQTFTFMDPVALESSRNPTYYQAPESMSHKSKYSNSDLQVVQGPSFNQDPNEPLQTSLDAYVPAQPVYYPSTNDKNTVYKEAVSVGGSVYKEASNLSSKEKSR